MPEIKDFLDKYKKTLIGAQIQNEILVKILSKAIGHQFKNSDFKIKKSVLFVKGNSYLKSEIYLNKEKILREIKKEGIEKEILDIK